MHPETKQLAEQFAAGQRLPVWLKIAAHPNLAKQIHRAIDVHEYLRTHFEEHSVSLAFQFHQMCYFAEELNGEN